LLLYEKKVSSFPKLVDELRILDLDAGVRTIGKYQSKKCFVFVTRSLNGYTTALYGIKSAGKEKLPDKRLLIKEFGSLEELEQFLSGAVAKPVEAFAY
jgi:hypothetical protein